MIVKSSEADRYAASPPKHMVAALVFGPDQGLVRERAERMAKTVVPDLGDAFQVSDLDEAALNGDPARLADEAAAISMLGGRRVVRVRDGLIQGDGPASALHDDRGYLHHDGAPVPAPAPASPSRTAAPPDDAPQHIR